MLQIFIWEDLEIREEVLDTRLELRYLIQQLTENGLKHARHPVRSTQPLHV